MITINTKSLKAACLVAATKGVRYYLNGVQVLVREDGEAFIRATDGTVAFEDIQAHEAPGPVDLIIPIDVAKGAAKSKASVIDLVAVGDGQYTLAGYIFKPIDGKFPDIDRVMPKRSPEHDATVAHYDADLLARCQAAMRLATGKSKAFFKVQNSPTGLAHRENEEYPRCAIMPLRPSAFEGN